MANRFTERAQRIVLQSHAEAVGRKSPEVLPEHLLLALLWIGGGQGCEILVKSKIDLGNLLSVVTDRLGPSGSYIPIEGSIHFAPSLKRVLEIAVREADRRSHAYVGSGHLLAALLAEEDSMAAGFLRDAGLTPESVDKHLLGECEPERP